MFTRACHCFMSNKSPHYCSPLPPPVIEELQFWQTCPISFFSSPIWPPLFTPHSRLECDAGAHGWAGVLGPHSAHGYFPHHLSHNFASSTLREVLGILRCLQSFCSLLHSSSVQILTDNHNAPIICKRGSPNSDLNTVAKQIWSLVRAHRIFVHVTWVPRSLNQAADALSHFHDASDWSLHPSIFHALHRAWGPFSIDRFASHTNRLLPRFNSFFWCPDSAGVNALHQTDWHLHFNWCHPPYSQIPQLLSLLIRTQAQAAVLLPFWPSRPWWPLLADGPCFRPFVKACKFFEPTPSFLIPGPSTSSNQRHFLRWRFLALKISFAPSSSPLIPLPP